MCGFFQKGLRVCLCIFKADIYCILCRHAFITFFKGQIKIQIDKLLVMQISRAKWYLAKLLLRKNWFLIWWVLTHGIQYTTDKNVIINGARSNNHSTFWATLYISRAYWSLDRCLFITVLCWCGVTVIKGRAFIKVKSAWIDIKEKSLASMSM